jgi:hypothetical protein
LSFKVGIVAVLGKQEATIQVANIIPAVACETELSIHWGIDVIIRGDKATTEEMFNISGGFRTSEMSWNRSPLAKNQ